MEMLNKGTEKYNIKVLVTKYILEILEKDIKHFRISKNKLSNLILIKFSLKFQSDYFQEMNFEEKEYLQFTLHKENINYYSQMKRATNGLNESEMIREIFSSYAVLPSFLRELSIFREKVSFLNIALKERKKLKLHTTQGIIETNINKILRDKGTGYLQIETDTERYFISQIEIIN